MARLEELASLSHRRLWRLRQFSECGFCAGMAMRRDDEGIPKADYRIFAGSRSEHYFDINRVATDYQAGSYQIALLARALPPYQPLTHRGFSMEAIEKLTQIVVFNVQWLRRRLESRLERVEVTLHDQSQGEKALQHCDGGWCLLPRHWRAWTPARALFTDLDSPPSPRRGRPKGATIATPHTPKKRALSPDARERIGAAQRSGGPRNSKRN